MIRRSLQPPLPTALCPTSLPVIQHMLIPEYRYVNMHSLHLPGKGRAGVQNTPSKFIPYRLAIYMFLSLPVHALIVRIYEFLWVQSHFKYGVSFSVGNWFVVLTRYRYSCDYRSISSCDRPVAYTSSIWKWGERNGKAVKLGWPMSFAQIDAGQESKYYRWKARLTKHNYTYEALLLFFRFHVRAVLHSEGSPHWINS